MKDSKADFGRRFSKVIFTVFIHQNMQTESMSTRHAEIPKSKSQRTLSTSLRILSKSQTSTKSRKSNSSVHIQIKSESQFEFVPQDIEELSFSSWWIMGVEHFSQWELS